MVKISHPNSYKDELAFIIDQYATLQEIDEKASDYAFETMLNNPPNIKVMMPVYIVDFDSVPREETEKHIGFIRMFVVDNLIQIEHLTLGSEVINSSWDAVDFYGGKYGLTSN